MTSQEEKGRIFRALHARQGAFIIPNPHDPGTARVLEHLGFEALATTSAGFAFSVGRKDNAIGRERMLEHAAAMAIAVDVPVSADLENGFGDEPDAVAATIRLAAKTGLAGCSIEDSRNRPGDPVYPIELAADRIAAAAEAARALPFPFTLTARAENYLHGRPDLADTIRRLQAFQEAGADVLYAPGLASREAIAAVVRSVDRPVNVVMGLVGFRLTLAELAALGVKRVSVGGAIARTAFGAVIRAAKEMLEKGTFDFAEQAVSSKELGPVFEPREP